MFFFIFYCLPDIRLVAIHISSFISTCLVWSPYVFERQQSGELGFNSSLHVYKKNVFVYCVPFNRKPFVYNEMCIELIHWVNANKIDNWISNINCCLLKANTAKHPRTFNKQHILVCFKCYLFLRFLLVVR